MKDTVEVENIVIVESRTDSHVVLLFLLSFRTANEAVRYPNRFEEGQAAFDSIW
jgi:hypothetical protein